MARPPANSQLPAPESREDLSSSRVDSATMNRSRDSAAARDTDHSNRGISIRAFRRMARKTPCHRGDRTDNRRDNGLLGSVPQRSRSALSSSFRKAGKGNFLSGLLAPGALLVARVEPLRRGQSQTFSSPYLLLKQKRRKRTLASNGRRKILVIPSVRQFPKVSQRGLNDLMPARTSPQRSACDGDCAGIASDE